MAIKFRDLTGKKFGELTVLYRKGTTTYKKVSWKCRCDCGKITYAVTGHLINGERVSCGCAKLDKRKYYLDITDVCCSNVFGQYRKWAKTKNREFILDKKEFKKLIFSNCHYCGMGLSNTFTTKRKKWKNTFHDSCDYNGVDRIDSSQGYRIDNVVSCCMYCNKMKNNMTLCEFEERIKKLYNYFIAKTTT